jgi:hypothetical protein
MMGGTLIVIRDGKSRKDRVTRLPAAVEAPLMTHIDHVRAQYHVDLRRGARLGRAIRTRTCSTGARPCPSPADRIFLS